MFGKKVRQRSGVTGVFVLAAGIAAVFSPWSVSPSRSVVPAAPGAAANEMAAQADAASLLSDLSLPSGATQSSVEPAGEDSVLAHPGSGPPATPNAIDTSAWWLIPAAPPAVLAYIEAHRPAESMPASTGTGSTGTNGTKYEVTTYALPQVAGVLDTRQIVIELVRLPDGSTGLRADAQVVWVTPRPPSEQIPPGTRQLRVSVKSSIKGNKPKQRPLTLTSPRRLREIVALINALPAAQPGIRSCPADFGIGIRLAFYPAHKATPLAVATIDPYGCQGVQLTIRGHREPPLESAHYPSSGALKKTPLIQRLDTLLGVSLNMQHT